MEGSQQDCSLLLFICLFCTERGEAGQPSADERLREPWCGPSPRVELGSGEVGQYDGTEERLPPPPALPEPGAGGEPKSSGCRSRAGFSKDRSFAVHTAHTVSNAPLCLL